MLRRERYTSPGMNRRLLGAVSALTAASIWGGMYVVAEVVLAVIPPATLLVVRYVLALLLLIPAFAIKRDRGIPRRDWPEMALVGFVGFGVSLLAQFGGTSLSTAAAGAVITSATPRSSSCLRGRCCAKFRRRRSWPRWRWRRSG